MSHSSRNKRTTLKDVAEWASVSMMTVSNVVNGKGDRVGEDVRLRVLEGINALKYRPQLRGRSLRLSRDFSIGLVILHPERRFLNDPFNTEVAAGMSNRIAADGYGLMIIGAQNKKDLETKLARVSQLDAIAVFAFGDRPQRRKIYAELAELGLPMMLIGDDMTDGLPDASFVRQDNEAGASALAETVFGAGARQILFIRPDHVWPAMTQRERGIRSAIGSRAQVETIACSEMDFTAIVAAVRSRLEQAPKIDAVMGGNDLFGIAAMHAAQHLGLKVPQDLMISGFNGFPFRDLSFPLLTSARSPAYEIGSVAAEQLIARIEKGSFQTPGIVLDVIQLPGMTTPPTA